MKFERTEWIGHATARRKLIDNAWVYEDDQNHVYAIDACLHGVCLVTLDGFIERLEAEGVGAGCELRERRLLAYEKNLNPEAFKRHLEWIINRKREIERATAYQAEISRLRAHIAATPPVAALPPLNIQAEIIETTNSKIQAADRGRPLNRNALTAVIERAKTQALLIRNQPQSS